jgi:hypothetical protein
VRKLLMFLVALATIVFAVVSPAFAQWTLPALMRAMQAEEVAKLKAEIAELKQSRSINRVFVLDEFLVDPMPPVMTSPNPSVQKAARDRSSWNDDCPKMPYFCPRRSRLQ